MEEEAIEVITSSTCRGLLMMHESNILRMRVFLRMNYDGDLSWKEISILRERR